MSAFPIIEHNLVRATVTPEIVRLIRKYYKISENEALMRFYQSKTAENYADEDTVQQITTTGSLESFRLTTILSFTDIEFIDEMCISHLLQYHKQSWNV